MGDDTSRSSSRNKFPSRKRLSMEETTRQEVLVSVNKKKTKKPFQKDVAPELESSHKNVLTEANSNTDQPPPLKKKNRRRKKPVHHENSLFEQMKISANNNKEIDENSDEEFLHSLKTQPLSAKDSDELTATCSSLGLDAAENKNESVFPAANNQLNSDTSREKYGLDTAASNISPSDMSSCFGPNTSTASQHVTATSHVSTASSQYIQPALGAHQYFQPGAHQYLLPGANQYTPPFTNQYTPPFTNQYIPPFDNHYIPPSTNQYIPPSTNPYIPPSTNQYMPPSANQYSTPVANQYISPTCSKSISSANKQSIAPATSPSISPDGSQSILPADTQNIPGPGNGNVNQASLFSHSSMFPIDPMILESLSTEKLSTYVGDLMQLLYSREFLKTHKMTNQTGGRNGNTGKLVMNQLELAQIIKAVQDNFIPKPKRSDITRIITAKFNNASRKNKEN